MIKTIFLDIGGVLLTNGWDTASRKKAAETFGYDFEEAEKRHRLMYSTHELGKLSLDTYVEFTFFYKERHFSIDDYKKFMYEQSKPYPDMLGMIQGLKKEYGLKIGVVSNEGKELTKYRVENWLHDFVDFFCVSGFVGYRKPDPDIFHLAVDLAQMKPSDIAYVEDRKEFVDMSNSLGLHGVHHTAIETTREKLLELLK